MIGDHQRASHSASRGSHAVLLDEPGVRTRTTAAAPSRPPRRTRPRAPRAGACIGESRRSRSDAHCSAGVDDAVGLVERLARARADVRARLLVRRGSGAMSEQCRSISDSPCTIHSATRLADAGALLDPDRSRRPEALDVGRLAEDRHAVRRQGDESVDGVLHADVLVADDLGHQLERVLHLRLEVGLRERELGRRERGLLDRGDLLGVVQDRPVRVGADLEADAVLALVHEDVHVAHDRELDRLGRGLEARHGADVDHLVHGRRERDVRAGHARDARAPDAAGDHERLGLDVAARRPQPPHAAALDVDAEHLACSANTDSAPVPGRARA